MSAQLTSLFPATVFPIQFTQTQPRISGLQSPRQSLHYALQGQGAIGLQTHFQPRRTPEELRRNQAQLLRQSIDQRYTPKPEIDTTKYKRIRKKKIKPSTPWRDPNHEDHLVFLAAQREKIEQARQLTGIFSLPPFQQPPRPEPDPDPIRYFEQHDSEQLVKVKLASTRDLVEVVSDQEPLTNAFLCPDHVDTTNRADLMTFMWPNSEEAHFFATV